MSLANWEDILAVCNQLNRVFIHENKRRKHSLTDTTKWEEEVGPLKSKLGKRNVRNSSSII